MRLVSEIIFGALGWRANLSQLSLRKIWLPLSLTVAGLEPAQHAGNDLWW